MGTIPNSSLPFNDNAVNGDNVDSNAWNQALQVVQLAVNDNQSQINAIKNAQTTILVAHGVAYPTNPAPSAGQLFYRDDLSQLKMFNGTQWEDVESVVATANGLSINGVTYDISTSAIANTIALRDATGSLTAQTFNGNLNGNATSATNNAPKVGSIGIEFEVASLFVGSSTGSGGSGMYAVGNTTSANPAFVNMAGQTSYTFDVPDVLINTVNSSASYVLEVHMQNSGSTSQYAGLWDDSISSLVPNSTITLSTTTGGVYRSSAITLVSGHKYRLAAWVASTVTHQIYQARIVGQI